MNQNKSESASQNVACCHLHLCVLYTRSVMKLLIISVDVEQDW